MNDLESSINHTLTKRSITFHHFTVPSTGCTVVNTMIKSEEYWCCLDIFYVMFTQCYESSDKNAMESVAMTRGRVSMTSYAYG
jgi:hypothetical protein